MSLPTNFKDNFASNLKKLAGVMPVGTPWWGFDPKAKPAGVQLYAGQLLARSSYEAHWSLVSSKHTVLSESEWQARIAADGFCPFYSSGDGSTTYRMPLIKGVHPEFVEALAKAGQYKEAGLPNITGAVTNMNVSSGAGEPISSGAFSASTETNSYSGFSSYNGHYLTEFSIDASLSSSVYGNSDTVQPPSITCVLGEYVFGVIASIGEADVEALVERIDKLETRAPGVPLGTPLPYTGKDVPAGTLRADGAVYSMQAAFPDFYEWVKNSGLTVPLADYALVEGSCGFYGIDDSTGTVRMPTLAAGVFGTTAAGQYGAAVGAGLPNITGGVGTSTDTTPSGAFYQGDNNKAGGWDYVKKETCFDASLSSPIYGASDTVQPPHVKYPWVIVVYSAAVPMSTAEAAEFINLLDGKADINLGNVTAEGKSKIIGGVMPDYSSSVSIASKSTYIAPANGYISFVAESNTSTTESVNTNPDGNSGYLQIAGKTVLQTAYRSNGDWCHPDGVLFPVSKGETVYYTFKFGSVYFYPCKGA